MRNVLFLLTILLPFGVTDEQGETHREVELGPLTLRETLAATHDAKVLTRPEFMLEEEWAGICMLSRRIRRVGTLSGPFTPDWILDLLEEDSMALLDGAAEVVKNQRSFRGGTPVLEGGADAGGEADGVVQS